MLTRPWAPPECTTSGPLPAPEMAFMMPVMKKNYALYASPAADQRQRRTSDQTDGQQRRANSLNTPTASARRRQVKSEGQSLSTSPGNVEPMAGVQRTRPVDVQHLRRGRGSAPALIPVPATMHASLQRHAHMMGEARPSSSAPSGNSPAANGSSQSRSSISSESSGESVAVTGKFHSRLVMRLRKTFRLKDPEPTST